VPNAIVIGDVTLTEESSVWYGAVLRGDINRITIGLRSNVQDNAVVHIDTPSETRPRVAQASSHVWRVPQTVAGAFVAGNALYNGQDHRRSCVRYPELTSHVTV
jgi:hypothetical protein